MGKIFYKNKLLAIQIKSIGRGTKPITSNGEALQLLTFKYTKGKIVAAHIHKPKRRITNRLQECLIVFKGKIKITLYSDEREGFKNLYLNSGQAVIFLSGGHRIEVLEDAEIYELKNGPFIDDKVFIEEKKKNEKKK